MLPPDFVDHLERRYGQRLKDYRIPPPVFVAMKGEIISVDLDSSALRTRFPVLDEQLNPYGSMQGGIIAAAVDNTLGPLSMLVAPENVTRRLELKFSQPVTPDIGFIMVTATLRKQDGRWLHFLAEVRAENGQLLAKATAVHWIVVQSADA